MAKKNNAQVNLDFAFFTFLHQFYKENRPAIYAQYKDLTKKFLSHNSPANAKSFLRQPQYEALEIYIFLKEFLDNAPVYKIFQDWMHRTGKFQAREQVEGAGVQTDMFQPMLKEQYEFLFQRMRSNKRSYSNYIFALTMGTGKTILMATCIFYEFMLANKYRKDPRYCHNALIFAPDKTVLQSLREIESFEISKVVPAEYVSLIRSNIQYHFLDEAGMTLNILDKSRFNLIVSNTQKIILKRRGQEKSLTDKLFGSGKVTYEPGTVYEENADLYETTEPDNEDALTTNQRFEKLRRLEQLGIYVDEAHHAFGNQLAKDMGVSQSDTSLRVTIDQLAANLEQAGTRVVACYNYTGTPYVGRTVLPEVVYAFGLQEAINKGFLKKVKIEGYHNARTSEFVKLVIKDFLKHTDGKRHEGMLPKLAFFAATIDELRKELRPAVEKALSEHGLPPESILVNVGDEKLTTNDDIREFNRLDTSASTKQFILLVNKGREGWNCRSLFGVGLFRQPKSKIFVLQATMRCLRAIGETQQTGRVYLSEDNVQILNDELQQNFHISVDEMQAAGDDKDKYEIRVVPPPVRIQLQRVRHHFDLKEKAIVSGVRLDLEQADTERYRLIHTQQEGLSVTTAAQSQVFSTEDLTHLREKRQFSELTLVAEIARYLNKPCLLIEEVLAQTHEGTPAILKAVNEFNELLYDWVIPRLFSLLYDITKLEKTEAYEVELIKDPEKGYYEVTAAEDKVIKRQDVQSAVVSKSFHLDTYCFDSLPERELFLKLLYAAEVQKVYFTGMLTHGQTEFFVQYIDPISHTVRSYYPDFIFQKNDDTYVIVEVKADNETDDLVVLAKKEFAEQMAIASGMTYRMITGSKALKGEYAALLNGGASHAQASLPA